MNRRYHLRRVGDEKTLAMAKEIFAVLKSASNMGCEWFVWDMKDGKRVSL